MNNDLHKIQSLTIDWLRFPLTILIFFIHMNPQNHDSFIEMNKITWTNGLNLNEIYSIMGTFISMFSSIAVPSFFMFSGFLFFYKFNEWNWTIYFNKVKKRIKTLCVPYLLWNILTVIVTLTVIVIKRESIFDYLSDIWDKGVLHIFWDSTTWGEGSVNIFGWSQQKWGPVNLPLWFLRDLIVVSFFTPVLFLGIKYLKKYFIVLLGIAFCFSMWIITPGFSIMAFFFFSIGAYLGIHDKNMVEVFCKKKYLFSIIALITLISSVVLNGTEITKLTTPLFLITGVVSVFALSANYIQKKNSVININLSKSSFFLYCMHTIFVLSISHAICNKIFGTKNMVGINISYLVTPFLCTTICLVIFFSLKRLTPSFLNILTGSRK